jgi:hypothetical protein
MRWNKAENREGLQRRSTLSLERRNEVGKDAYYIVRNKRVIQGARVSGKKEASDDNLQLKHFINKSGVIEFESLVVL